MSKGLDGWLEKQADWTLSWRRRLFHLQGLLLSYRLDEQSPDKDNGHIQCVERNTGSACQFRVWTERGACWTLRAASEAEHMLWTDNIVAQLELKETVVGTGAAAAECREMVETYREDEEDAEAYGGTVVVHSMAKALQGGADNRGSSSGGGGGGGGVLHAHVDKLSAWMRTWRRRFVTLDELALTYADTEREPPKNRFVVRSVDRTNASQRELFIETTAGEVFTIRFLRDTECELWFSSMRQALRAQGLRWHGLVASGSAALSLASPFHCSVLLPPSKRSGGAHAGTNPLGLAKTVIVAVPSAAPLDGSTDADAGSTTATVLVRLSLAAQHPVLPLPVDAFPVAPGVAVRPCGRTMAAMAVCGDDGIFLYGGLAQQHLHLGGRGLPSAAEQDLPVLPDMWSVRLPRESGSACRWECRAGRKEDAKTTAAAGYQETLAVAGHSMTAVPRSVLRMDQRDTHNDSCEDSSQMLLIVGGFRADGVAVSTCRLFDPSTNTFLDFPRLDAPRCLHGCALLGDGTILVVGGLPAASAKQQALASASFYNPRTQCWAPLGLSSGGSPLRMVHPQVGVLGVEAVVFAGSAHASQLPQVFSMVIVGDTLVVKVLPCVGDSPVTHAGVSAVVDDEAHVLYVIGSNPSDAAAPHLHRLLLS